MNLRLDENNRWDSEYRCLINELLSSLVAGTFHRTLHFDSSKSAKMACTQSRCKTFLISSNVALLHLVALGAIVVMEFGLGVTLLIVRKTVENYIANKECNNDCAATLDSLVLDYALPATGLMLTIIVIEATMMYSAIKLWYHIREAPKIIDASNIGTTTQNVQMRSGTLLPSYSASPHPVFSPSLNYLPNRRHPAFATNSPLPWYQSHLESMKPPQYDTLSPDLQHPPTYMEVVPGTLINRTSRTDEMDRRPASCNSL
ncbi:unnamed protein product [Larinioides sclopetarius]|uniref:Uncharacterized protein n=1 Tax=Larinioides sclopetarius TaxID=280406 RepID=A0AAV1ZYN5_9ARAC